MVEIGNVENVCRLCLSADEPRFSVFAQDREEDPSGVPLTAKIQACLSIQVRNFILLLVQIDSRHFRGENRRLQGRVSLIDLNSSERSLIECATPKARVLRLHSHKKG